MQAENNLYYSKNMLSLVLQEEVHYSDIQVQDFLQPAHKLIALLRFCGKHFLEKNKDTAVSIPSEAGENIDKFVILR